MKGLDQVIDPSYKPMLAMYHQLRMNNKHIYDELKTEKFFSIRMVGIDPKMRGRGVATDLIRRLIFLVFYFKWYIWFKGQFSLLGVLDFPASRQKLLDKSQRKHFLLWECSKLSTILI